MVSNMEYFLFYISFEGKIMPIYCLEIEDDPIIKGHTLFKGVKHLNDDAFPKLKVHQISLPTEDIKYYLKGNEIEESNNSSATPKKKPEIDYEIENEKLKKTDSKEDSESNIFKRKKRKRGFVRNY